MAGLVESGWMDIKTEILDRLEAMFIRNNLISIDVKTFSKVNA